MFFQKSREYLCVPFHGGSLSLLLLTQHHRRNTFSNKLVKTRFGQMTPTLITHRLDLIKLWFFLPDFIRDKDLGITHRRLIN